MQEKLEKQFCIIVPLSVACRSDENLPHFFLWWQLLVTRSSPLTALHIAKNFKKREIIWKKHFLRFGKGDLTSNIRSYVKKLPLL